MKFPRSIMVMMGIVAIVLLTLGIVDYAHRASIQVDNPATATIIDGTPAPEQWQPPAIEIRDGVIKPGHISCPEGKELSIQVFDVDPDTSVEIVAVGTQWKRMVISCISRRGEEK